MRRQLSGFAAFGHRGVGLVYPHQSIRLGTSTFGESGVVSVDVRGHHGLQHAALSGQGPLQQVPSAGIDQRELSPSSTGR
jgi:hypothetical protein